MLAPEGSLLFCSSALHEAKLVSRGIQCPAGSTRHRRCEALFSCAAGPPQAPGVAAKPRGPEMGPDGPITPLVEEFGTPRSDGSPAQVCSQMLAPFMCICRVLWSSGLCHAQSLATLKAMHVLSQR